MGFKVATRHDASLAERAASVWTAAREILRTNFFDPDPEQAFEPPATDETLAGLEAHIGHSLPEELKALYRVHDGCPFPLLVSGLSLLGCAGIAEAWTNAVEIDAIAPWDGEPVLDEAEMHYEIGFDQRRRLIIGERDDLHACLDFVPGPRGYRGQVLVLVTECDYEVVGTDLLSHLERWVELIESGAVTYDERYGYFTEHRRRPRSGLEDLIRLVRVPPRQPRG